MMASQNIYVGLTFIVEQINVKRCDALLIINKMLINKCVNIALSITFKYTA